MRQVKFNKKENNNSLLSIKDKMKREKQLKLRKFSMIFEERINLGHIEMKLEDSICSVCLKDNQINWKT